tara:strand:- start:346 stop:531 length:186 start_codon:yes stop_codon:yes gene_type:complete
MYLHTANNVKGVLETALLFNHPIFVEVKGTWVKATQSGAIRAALPKEVAQIEAGQFGEVAK